MHAHRQSRRGPRGRDASSKRCAIGQQRSASDDAVLKGLEDSAIYTLRPSQVIRVDDKTLHDLYRFLPLPCPFGQLLVCATDEIGTIDRFRPQL